MPRVCRLFCTVVSVYVTYSVLNYIHSINIQRSPVSSFDRLFFVFRRIEQN